MASSLTQSAHAPPPSVVGHLTLVLTGAFGPVEHDPGCRAGLVPVAPPPPAQDEPDQRAHRDPATDAEEQRAGGGHAPRMPSGSRSSNRPSGRELKHHERAAFACVARMTTGARPTSVECRSAGSEGGRESSLCIHGRLSATTARRGRPGDGSATWSPHRGCSWTRRT